MWQRLLFFLQTLSLWLARARAGASLMGLGGGGGMVKGSSFALDTKDPRKTRVHGNGLQIELDVLELMMGSGIIRYSPTHVEFEKGLSRWISMFNEEKLSLHFNEKVVLQLYSPDESPYFQFSMPQGNGVFRDVLLDKSLNQKISLQLCLVDNVFDPSLSVEMCQQKSEVSSTVSSHLENLALTMVFLSEKIFGTEEAVSQSLTSKIEDLFVHPLSLNISNLSANVTSIFQSLDSKILQSSQEMATRTLNSFRNLSSAIGSNMTLLRDSFVEIISRQNETIQNMQNDILKEIRTSDQIVIDAVWTNITRINETINENVAETGKKLAAVLHEQINELNFTLLTIYHEAIVNLNSTDQRLTRMDTLWNSSLEHLQTFLLSNVTAATDRSLASLESLNTTLTSNIFQSHNLTLFYLHDTHRQLEENITTATTAFNSSFHNLRAEVDSMFEEIHSSILNLNMTLQHTIELMGNLSSNTSQAIARSNAILTRVIADVNISLTEYKNVSMTYFESMFENFLHSLHTTQANFRKELENASAMVRSEVVEMSRLQGDSVLSLNASILNSVAELKNESRSSIISLNNSIDLLSTLVNTNQHELESQISLVNTSLLGQVFNSFDELQSLLNFSTTQLKDEITYQTASGSSKVQQLNQSSEISFQELRKAVYEMGILLYPPKSGDVRHLRPHSSLVDESWYPTFINLSQNPVIFDTLADQLSNLTSQLDTNLTTLKNQTSLELIALRDLISSTKFDIDMSVNETSLFFQSLIQLLNESLVEEKVFAVVRTQSLESRLINSTDSLEILIRNSLSKLGNDLVSYQIDINKTLTYLRDDITDRLIEHRDLSVQDSNRLFTLLDLLNQTLQSTNSSLSADIERAGTYLVENITFLANITNRKVALVVQNLTEELTALRNVVLLETIPSMQLSNQNRFNETDRTIALLGQSTSSSIKEVAENTTNNLLSLSHNLTTAINQLMVDLASTHAMLAESIRHLQLNSTAEASATNATLKLHGSRFANLTSEFQEYQRNQSNMWVQNMKNISLFNQSTLMLISQLNSTIAEIQQALTSSIQHSLFELSSQWNETFRKSNDSHLARTDEVSRNASISLIHLNITFKDSLMNLTSHLLNEHSQLESDLKAVISVLQSNLTREDELTRETLTRLLEKSVQQVNTVIAVMNSTILDELAMQSKNVSLALESSLHNLSSLLHDHTLRQEGKLELVAHRLDNLETASKSLTEFSVSSALDHALLKADVAQANVSLTDTRLNLLQMLSTLQGVEIRLFNVSSLANLSREDLIALRAEHLALQSQFTQLSLNTSTNLLLLQQIFASINTSQLTSHLFFEEVRDRVSALRSEFEKEKLRNEGVSDEVTALSQAALPRVTSQIEEVRAEGAKERNRLEERLKGEERQLAELGTADEILGKRIATLELDMRTVREHELANVKKGVDEGRSRCETITGDLRKEVDRSQSEVDSQEKKIKELGERLAILETKSNYQDKRISELVEENEKLRKNMASQSSVDDLRKLIQDLQSSMLSHSNKVLDVVISKLASSPAQSSAS